MAKRNKVQCEWCTKKVAVTAVGEMYRHNNWSLKKCAGSHSTIVARTIYHHAKNYDWNAPRGRLRDSENMG